MMSDCDYEFDIVDRLMRCTWTGHDGKQQPKEYIRDYIGEWVDVQTWKTVSSDRDAEIELALLQHEYNEALERSKQSDHPPMPAPTQLSDSIHEVIRQAVIASNVETHSQLMDQNHELAQRVGKLEQTTNSLWNTMEMGIPPNA